MEIVVDAKVTAGPEGVAATEKEPDTQEGGREGEKADQSVDREEAGSTLATCFANRNNSLLCAPFSHPSRHFSHFSPHRVIHLAFFHSHSPPSPLRSSRIRIRIHVFYFFVSRESTMSTGFTLGLEYVLLLSAEETVVDSFRLLYVYIYIYRRME